VKRIIVILDLSSNFALFSLINENINPAIIPQFEKIVFLTWGFCLQRSAALNGTVCKAADLTHIPSL
jgi:hypothetical protein